MRPEAMIRRLICLLVGVLVAAGLAACGGSSSSSSSSSHPGPARAGAAADAGRAATLVAETFGPNPAANSGHVSGTIDISVTGAPQYREPISLSMVGRFNDPAGSSLAEWDLLLGAQVRGLVFGAGMTSSGEKVYLNVGSTAFVIPDSAVALMRANARDAQNGLARILSGFGLRPQTWIRNPRIVGNEQLAGTEVTHGTADIAASRVFADAGRFTELLAALRVTSLAGLPDAIGPAAQAALARSVTTARGDLYAGTSDHVIRKARMSMTLAVAPADRKLLGGVRRATIDVNLDVSEVGAPQQIKVQADRQPWANAIPLLNAAAFGNRPAGQRGK